MDPQCIDVLHVADRDAVILGIADHLVLDLFPTFQVLLDEDLWSVGEGIVGHLGQLFGISRNAGTLASQ